MNPQTAQKKIVSVEFGPSPLAKNVQEKNLIAVFDDGSIQSIGTYARVLASIKAMDNQLNQLTVNKATWTAVKTLADAMPEFVAAAQTTANAAALPSTPTTAPTAAPAVALNTTAPSAGAALAPSTTGAVTPSEAAAPARTDLAS